MALYEIVVLGSPTTKQLSDLENYLKSIAQSFQLEIGSDIRLSVTPSTFTPNARSASAGIFFGGKDSSIIDIEAVLDVTSIPILPVISSKDNHSAEIPKALKAFNAIIYDENEPQKTFCALLESVGLLPIQRRVFLSYRQKEATPIAIQLFNELSARKYEVFLDTHSIGHTADFQEELWHQLCNVDVLIMLETPGYFESRWTEQEFGRALAKGIGILQIQWPDSTPSIITGTCSRVELLSNELTVNGTLNESAIERISRQLEQVRTLSHAVRQISMTSAVEAAITKIQGRVSGLGPRNVMYLTLRNGEEVVVQTSLSVPNATTLQNTLEYAGSIKSAIVYDHLGLKPSWQKHLEWLGTNIKGAKWIKSSEASYELAGLV